MSIMYSYNTQMLSNNKQSVVLDNNFRFQLDVSRIQF